MTPVSDLRRKSLMPEPHVTRSRSDTSSDGLASVFCEHSRTSGRRSSEWAANDKMVLRPLQLSESQDFGGLLMRRMSKVSPKGTSAPSEGVSRSYSVKSVKKIAEARQRHRGSSIPSEGTHTGAKVKERTVSNRSLPLPGDESEYYTRLRNFSVTSKGVVNRGDSFRSKSSPQVSVLESTGSETIPESKTAPLQSPEEEQPLQRKGRSFRVLLLGSPGVGKTALRKQFMTSEYICAYDLAHDQDIDRAITVVLNNEESQMEFEEETFHGGNVIYCCCCPDSESDAFLVVYSVTDRRTFSQARQILSQVEQHAERKAVILVGNKTDLARLRMVTTEEGRSLAKERGCKFIETSVAINHQVDELLVGALAQIRMKAKVADKLRKKRESQGTNRRGSIYSASKASGVLKKILRRACMKSKSCDNLHVL
ncbi:GTP-binding protein RAD-like [Uloborus diversus]|uniref:GTP-binding protein RAD-like n=1 Tax=Uloborus diversus TaxID=327109 RepID=UPI002409D480|nr:GTP-binding protein RAD-like [Uloborus diversus]